MDKRAAGRSAPRVRARRLAGRRADLGRVPRLRGLPRPARRRPAPDRQRQGLRRAVRDRDRQPASSRAPASALDKIDISEGHRRGDRRRVGRPGTATTRSTPTARRSRSSRWTMLTFPRAPLSGHPRLRRDRRRHVRVAALRRQASASPTCSPATRASASCQGHALAARRHDAARSELRTPSRGASRCRAQGRLARTPEMDADFTLRFSDTSLDPVHPLRRAEIPAVHDRPSPTAPIRVVGELADIDHLLVEATVDKLQLKLFDYPGGQRRPDPARARTSTSSR